MLKNEINIQTCAKFIKSIEDKTLSAEDYKFTREGSAFISSALYIHDGHPAGMTKCFVDTIYPTKQLDIRSIYALLYLIMDLDERFYPAHYIKNSEDYKAFLKKLNIPIGCDLYKYSLESLSDDIPNHPIGDSIFELADIGYEFEKNGNTYSLKRNRW